MVWHHVGLQDLETHRADITPIGELRVTSDTSRSLAIDPHTSLNAATSLGPGSALDGGQVINSATLLVSATGNPESFDVELQVSIDNVTWFNTGAAITVSGTAGNTEVQGRYYRANLTELEGGTTPTVTAIITATHM
jgi:hypothetical protein